MRDKNRPQDAIYIGRGKGSRLGNPFSHLNDTAAQWQVASREEAVACFEEWARARILVDRAFRDAIAALHGHNVVCWCAPSLCHGEILLQLAEELHSH